MLIQPLNNYYEKALIFKSQKGIKAKTKKEDKKGGEKKNDLSMMFILS